MTNFLRADIAAALMAILAGVIHIGAYWGLWWSPPETGTAFYWRIGISVTLIVIGCIIVGIATAITNKNAPASDEREDQANFRTMRNSMFIYAGGLAIIMMEAFGDMASSMALAHSVIGIFVVSEIVRIASLTYYLNRGH